MRKLSAALVAVALIGLLTPSVAAETVSKNYDIAVGVSPGVATSCNGASGGCDLLGDGTLVLPGIGVGDIAASSAYNNVVLSINDEGLWGAAGALDACFFTGADNICDGDDISSDIGCGGTALLGASQASDVVSVFVWTLHVDDTTLEVCGATFGTVSATFF